MQIDIACVFPRPTRLSSIFSRQFALDIQHIALTLHLNHAIHLRRIAHQLHCASVHHARRRVAVLRQIIKHDIRHGETARWLLSESESAATKTRHSGRPKTDQCERVTQQDESRRRVGKLVGNVLETGVDGVILWTDLFRFGVDDICKSTNGRSVGLRLSHYCIEQTQEREKARTDDALRVFGSRGSQPELPQFLLGFWRKGI